MAAKPSAGSRYPSGLHKFVQIKDNFLRAAQWLYGFNGAMPSGQRSSREARTWFVEADHVGVAPPPWRASWARNDEDRATSARAVIASSLFLVVLASALLIGGHAAIDPLLRSAIAAREAKGIGEVVYTMPDGIYCRHLSFDNATAEVAESSLERCSTNIAGVRIRSRSGFAWGR